MQWHDVRVVVRVQQRAVPHHHLGELRGALAVLGGGADVALGLGRVATGRVVGGLPPDRCIYFWPHRPTRVSRLSLKTRSSLHEVTVGCVATALVTDRGAQEATVVIDGRV